MLRIERILHPTDFSRCAEGAFPHALFLAGSFGAELHMLHAVVYHGEDPHRPDAHFPEPEEILERLHRLAGDRLDTLVRPHRAELRIETVRRRGLYAGPVILDYAREKGIDLIVLGTHGRRGPRRLLLGSVAEEVVRLADCPVLTLRELPEARTVEQVERVLAPVDFSVHSRRATAHARELAAIYGARVQLVHVIEEKQAPTFYGTLGGVHTEAVVSRLRQQAIAALADLAAEILGDAVPWDVYVVEGRAPSAIADFADDSGSDMIVLASHGLSGLERLLLGSTTEEVVRTARCPVLTIKAFGKSLIVDEDG